VTARYDAIIVGGSHVGLIYSFDLTRVVPG
jgi:hypothetical protein